MHSSSPFKHLIWTFYLRESTCQNRIRFWSVLHGRRLMEDREILTIVGRFSRTLCTSCYVLVVRARKNSYLSRAGHWPHKYPNCPIASIIERCYFYCQGGKNGDNCKHKANWCMSTASVCICSGSRTIKDDSSPYLLTLIVKPNLGHSCFHYNV